MEILKTTFTNALESIIFLDKEGYPETTYTKDWYLDRYSGSEDVFLYKVDGQIVAYAVITKVTKEFVASLFLGVFDGDMDVSNNMFINNGNLLYVSSIVVTKKFRRSGIGSALIKKIASNYKDCFVCALANIHTTPIFVNNNFKLICNCGKYNVLVN